MKNKENKKNVIVLFGGKSVEHDISIITGVQTLNAFNKKKYNIIPIYITKEGNFISTNLFFDINTFLNGSLLKVKYKKVTLSTDSYLYFYKGKNLKKWMKVDFAMLATHGGMGENGELQGFLDVCNIPYSSSNVLSSGIGMNKVVAKQILKNENIPITDYIVVNQNEFNKNFESIKEKIDSLTFPVIVKPANLGSSIGITFCKNICNFIQSIALQCYYNTIF